MPQINLYLYAKSVLILDNVRIYHDDGLLRYLDTFGICIEFLPYLLDFNPIENAFSYIKSYLRKYNYFVESCLDPIYPLLVVCSQISLLLSNAFFNEAGYK